MSTEPAFGSGPLECSCRCSTSGSTGHTGSMATLAWRYGKKKKGKAGASLTITHMKRKLYLPVCIFFFIAWGATYIVLATCTNSTVPLLDAFTNALSFVGLWALARKYIEQWFFWIAVDAVCFYLYVVKDIPFKAGLYGLYVFIAIAGYFKWRRMMAASKEQEAIEGKQNNV